ncbi:MAG: hypothetical protein JW723_02095, partial [Bacteroidales bacterium]|nr:hypothetical protein [Bacteroidales bacterium]
MTITISGGSPLYDFVYKSGGILSGNPWIDIKRNTTDTFAEVSGLGEGKYTFLAQHNNGVTVSFIEYTYTFLKYDPITVKKGLTCYDGSDAELEAHPKGGNPAYDYKWYKNVLSPGSEIGLSQVLTGVDRGFYIVQITDQDNCQVQATILFNEFNSNPAVRDSIPPKINVGVATSTPTCEGANGGSVTVNGSGGILPNNFAIKHIGFADSVFQAGNNIFTGLRSGYYIPYVLDSRGCAKSGSNILVDSVPQPVGPTLSAKTPDLATVCEGTGVSATFNAGTGGVGCSDEFEYRT